MRNQLIGILVLGILGLLGFGLMAAYLSDVNPRTKLKVLAEKRLPVEVEEVDDDAPEGARADTPRTVRIRARPRDGTAPTRELARALARLGQEVFERKEVQRVRVEGWVIELEGLARQEIPAAHTRRAIQLEETLASAKVAIAAALGEGLELAMREEAPGQFGLVVGGTLPDKAPEEIARLLLGRTGYQFAFVRIGERTIAAAEARAWKPPARPAPAGAAAPDPAK